MLPEWKVVGYLHHPLRQHFCFLMKLFSSQASCYDRAVRPPTSQSTIKAAVLTLKMENGFPCRPGCDTAPAQSIHMDLGVRMDGYGPPPPKKDGHPAWGGRLFLCGRELKPKRAACGQENSPGDCFPARRCAGGYRNAKRLGRQARKTRQRLPPPASTIHSHVTWEIIRIRLMVNLCWP